VTDPKEAAIPGESVHRNRALAPSLAVLRKLRPPRSTVLAG
jgi:hypothetical protein